jgi:DNA-3-methyladenine glycosylase II
MLDTSLHSHDKSIFAVTMTLHYWNDATRHLSRQCPTLKTLISRYKGEMLVPREDGFYSLLRAIVGQQISVKAADSVWAKVEKTVKPLSPQKLLSTPDEALRACGLSGQKVAYARNIAEFYKNRKTHAAAWEGHTDEEVIAALTTIKGIGSWTAEMFLMFHLARPNVLPLKDLGLLKAMNLYYVKEEKLAGKKWLSAEEYKAIAAPWAPYQTVATWYLWRALDPVPVAY